MLDRNRLIRIVNEYFKGQRDILVVYLFGSVAKGKNRMDSDVDLAVLFSARLDIYERFDKVLAISSDLEAILHTKVDVVDLLRTTPEFIHQVMLHKITIYESDVDKRVEFEVQARRAYFDMMRFFNLRHRQALKRLEEM